MTRHPSVGRALAQLERHGSGTPNDVPPAPPTWAEGLAAFNAAGGEISAKLLAGLDAWAASARSKQETT